jgi:hypothetical protein
MATRRRYKNPQGYRDGGRVLADVAIADDEPSDAGGFPSGILGDHLEHAGAALQDGTVPRSPPPSAEPPPAADDNPLQRALAAQTRAEQLQREALQRPPPSTIEQHIEKIPGLSEHKRAFLRQYPVLVEDPAVMKIFNNHYAKALQDGFTDDTPELDNHLVLETVREIEHRRQLALAGESEDVAVQRLEDEAAAIMRSEAPPAPKTSPPMAAARRSIPMSAPVSRESPMWSGRRGNDENNTLRADEREIARVSFPHLPAAQAEYEYLLNKRKMHEMKRDGRIQGDG